MPQKETLDNSQKTLASVEVAGHNVGIVGESRTIFDLPEADFRRAIGELKFNQRVCMLAKYFGASDEDLGKSFSTSKDGGQKFIKKALARTFELCDLIKSEREGSAEDE